MIIVQRYDGSCSSAITKPAPQETTNTWSNWMSVKSLMVMIAYVCFDIQYIVTFTFLPIKYQRLGITAARGSWLISLIGLMPVLVRFVAIITADKNMKISVYLASFSLFISGLVTALGPFYTEYWKLAIYCALLGASLGNNIKTTIIFYDSICFRWLSIHLKHTF